MTDFNAWLKAVQERTEHSLSAQLPAESLAPKKLHQAMRYAVLGGGKRVRAVLAHAAGELCSADANLVDYAACSVELIHAYSLIHDDLPCMDNDDLRRGKPSCHKQFDEATALLAGDALQTLAFEILSRPTSGLHNPLEMLHLLAQASGSLGMAGGQAIDLASEGLMLSQDELESMHRLKTGALIRAAGLMGVYCGNTTTSAELDAIDLYTQHMGLAFQVVDDLLDAEADTATLGKTAGKDAEQNKATYVTLLGKDKARALVQKLHQEALDCLQPFGTRAERLCQLATYITQRNF